MSRLGSWIRFQDPALARGGRVKTLCIFDVMTLCICDVILQDSYHITRNRQWSQVSSAACVRWCSRGVVAPTKNHHPAMQRCSIKRACMRSIAKSISGSSSVTAVVSLITRTSWLSIRTNLHAELALFVGASCSSWADGACSWADGARSWADGARSHLLPGWGWSSDRSPSYGRSLRSLATRSA